MNHPPSRSPIFATLAHSSSLSCVSKPRLFILNPLKNPRVMWRSVSSKLIISNSKAHSKFVCSSHSLSRACSYLGFSQDSTFPNKFSYRPLYDLDHGISSCFHELGCWKTNDLPSRNELVTGQLRHGGRKWVNFVGSSCKSYASVAEAVEVSHTDLEEDSIVNVCATDEVQELLNEVRKEERRKYSFQWKLQRFGEGMGKGKYKALKRRQVKIETEAWVQALKEYKELLSDMCEQKLAPNLPYMKSLFLGWFEPLRDKIAEEQELMRNGKKKANYAKYFDHLPADMMAIVTMHKLMGLLMTAGENGCTKVVQAACSIGEAIEQEVRIQKLLENTKKKKIINDIEKGGVGSVDNPPEQKSLGKKVADLIKKKKLGVLRQLINRQNGSKPWGQDAKAKVGSHLIELIIQTAYIQPPADQFVDSPPDVRPAFIHTCKTVVNETKGFCKRYGVIQCDPLVWKGLERTPRHMVIPYMPMLVHPVKWTGYDKGAYLYLPSYVMRTHGARQQREAVKMAPAKQMKIVFEALDTLGSTRWRVNKKVLDIVDRIWASGGRLADLVDHDDIPLPEQPDTEDEAVLKKWKWKVKAVKKENGERHSQRCDTELKLAVARKMKVEDGFFYPHNLDFRGRAYPMHPHLNHLGADICRGILEFSEGRPLGKSGLHWLKIHLANLFANGVDKLSHEGRLSFTESHLDDIFDSADKPLEGRRWWLTAEDPFQCLAVCFNLAEALRNPFPETAPSHIPVHQDGSCNGLQHYAALGRDKLGADAVNLIAGEKPADVYSGIASRVLDIMKKDAQKDPTIFPDSLHARFLINQVDRKLVKQTVMTSVYGVTYIGAREQIKRRLKERGVISDDNEIFFAACYAAKITLAALGQMFEAARSIMDWLGDCAKIIASENQPVRWTTPIGLPVVQPYHVPGRHLIRTSLQVLTLQRETDKVIVKKQKTAFPPNFVHSLDGSHMMMTAIACKKAGLNFAGVHDSYWTHACDVDKMNIILREKFVELYESPIMENLLEGFETAFPSLSFPPLPDRGDFNLRDVLDSPYFFN